MSEEYWIMIIGAVGFAAICWGGWLSARSQVPQLKGHSIWLTYLVGVSLVLLGRPGTTMSKFGLTAKGIEATFSPVEANSAEAKAAKDAAKASVTVSLNTADQADKVGGVPTESDAARMFSKFFAYVASIGFIPAHLGADNFLEPGQIIYLEDGKPVPWLPKTKAFPGTEAITAKAAIPRFKNIQENAGRGSNIDFEIDDGNLSQLPTNVLETGLSESAASALKGAKQPLYVVQAVLSAERILVEASEATGEQMLPDGSRTPRLSNSITFKAEAPTVIAYRLMRINAAVSR